MLCFFSITDSEMIIPRADISVKHESIANMFQD